MQPVFVQAFAQPVFQTPVGETDPDFRQTASASNSSDCPVDVCVLCGCLRYGNPGAVPAVSKGYFRIANPSDSGGVGRRHLCRLSVVLLYIRYPPATEMDYENLFVYNCGRRTDDSRMCPQRWAYGCGTFFRYPSCNTCAVLYREDLRCFEEGVLCLK